MPISVAGEKKSTYTGDYRVLAVGPAFSPRCRFHFWRAGRLWRATGQARPAVAVINERYAKSYFGGRNPLGQHLHFGNSGKTSLGRDMEIVGISKDARYGGLKGEISPVAYIAYDQGYPEPDRMVYELRTAGDPLRM